MRLLSIAAGHLWSSLKEVDPQTVGGNHFEQVQTQLARQPYAYPTLQIKRRPASIFDYAYEDFEVVGYEHHPAIKAPVAV